MDPIKRYYGVYRGVVKDNKDPQKQRRLKISITQTTGSEVTDWAWPMEPSSINTDVPVVGQGVWVTFIGGDPDYPVWSGAFGKNQGKNKKMFIKPLDDKTSLTGITDVIKITSKTDGTKDLDLTDTIIAIAQKEKSLQTTLNNLQTTVANIVQGTGVQGATGAQGTRGTQGVQGTQGTTGTGTQGTAGSQGANGTIGATGAVGSQGTQGATGAGTQGTQGTTGSQGTNGTQGTTGAGVQGAQGTLGSNGTQGTQGTTGAGTQGTQGASGSNGAQGTQGSIGEGTQGTQGTQGTSGSSGTQGTQGSVGTTGSQGTDGVQGTQGSVGTTGSQGTDGVQGTQGSLGNTGSQGTQGTTGEGTQGTQGTQGTAIQGTQGTQGVQGTVGVGTQGVQGTVGSQGTLGSQGTQGTIGATPTAPLTLSYSATVADPLTLTSGNQHGGSSYAGLMTLQSTISGATNPKKFVRMNNTGGLEIIDNSYSTTILSLSDSGALGTSGTITPGAYTAGQHIKTTIWSASDMSFTSTYTQSTATYSTIASKTYTPASSSSYLFVEVYARYYVNGAAEDSFFSQLTWNGIEFAAQRQYWANGSGGGTRSSTLFPLAGRITIASPTGYTLAVNARRDSADDTLSVYADGAFCVKITEIAR